MDNKEQSNTSVNDDKQSNTTENTDFNHELAWKLLGEKGLTFSERMKVRNAFTTWARGFSADVEKVPNSEWYKNKNVGHYCFDTEAEAEFVGALAKFATDANIEKIIQVMSIVIKLLDVKSDYRFNPKK
jgi:hypothetical protein